MNAVDFLKSKGLTQTQIAQELDCTVANVSLWFSGAASPTVKSIERVTDAMNKLGADVTYIEVFSAFLKAREEYKVKQ